MISIPICSYWPSFLSSLWVMRRKNWELSCWNDRNEEGFPRSKLSMFRISCLWSHFASLLMSLVTLISWLLGGSRKQRTLYLHDGDAESLLELNTIYCLMRKLDCLNRIVATAKAGMRRTFHILGFKGSFQDMQSKLSR
jgi:hypothetical protein